MATSRIMVASAAMIIKYTLIILIIALTMMV